MKDAWRRIKEGFQESIPEQQPTSPRRVSVLRRTVNRERRNELEGVLSEKGVDTSVVMQRLQIGANVPGIVTNLAEVVDYALSATDLPAAEVDITDPAQFSSGATAAKMYRDITEQEQAFPDNRSAYNVFNDIAVRNPFYVVVRVSETLPENASRINPALRWFGESMQGLTSENKNAKLIVYSANTAAIPTELAERLYPIRGK